MRLNARWFNFAKRGQAWDRFWQDGADAAVNASATGALAGLTLSAPTGTASASATATGAFAGLTLTAPTATASGTAAASASFASLTLAAPTASASGSATATGDLPALTLAAPTATAEAGEMPPDGRASGAFAPVALGIVMGFASATTAAPEVSLSAPGGGLKTRRTARRVQLVWPPEPDNQAPPATPAHTPRPRRQREHEDLLLL